MQKVNYFHWHGRQIGLRIHSTYRFTNSGWKWVETHAEVFNPATPHRTVTIDLDLLDYFYEDAVLAMPGMDLPVAPATLKVAA
jgi:hypothetical protein